MAGTEPDDIDAQEQELDLTSFHVRGAMAGRTESLAWVVEHFTPLLDAQARYRLRELGRGWIAPEDLVQEVWAVALPRLPQLTGQGTRWTPVLVKFLSTTLLHKCNKVLRRYIQDRQRGVASTSPSEEDHLAQLPAEVSGVVSQACRRERGERVRAAIDALDPVDREILVLRGIEQLPNQDVARRLDLQPPAVSMRFRRALERLAQQVPESVFADLLEG